MLKYIILYLITFIAIMISLWVTLYYKYELERIFREKKQVIAFHICNILIILMVVFAARTVIWVYIFEKEFKIIVPIFTLLLFILPIYIGGHYVFQHYQFLNRKYMVTEKGKVLVINEKYLRKK